MGHNYSGEGPEMAKAALIICDIQKDIVNFFAEKETAAGMMGALQGLLHEQR